MKKTLLSLALSAFVAVASSSAGAVTLFEAFIDQGQEPPHPDPAIGTGSLGTGYALLTLNDSETLLTYNISFQNLGSPLSDSHIHKGAKGTNGGIQHFFDDSLVIGAFSGVINGSWAVTPANVADLKANLLYVNIHTQQFGGGEIRGQIVPEPSSLLALAGGALGMAGLIRRKR